MRHDRHFPRSTESPLRKRSAAHDQSMHGIAAHREVVTGEVGGCVHVHRYQDEELRRWHFGDAFNMRYPALRRPVRTFSKLDVQNLERAHTRACTKARIAFVMHVQISGCHCMHRRGGQPFKGCERASACVSLNNMFGHVLTSCAAHDGTPHRCGLLRTRGTLEMPHGSHLRTCSARARHCFDCMLDCELCEEGGRHVISHAVVLDKYPDFVSLHEQSALLARMEPSMSIMVVADAPLNRTRLACPAD
jgi:hypothetical protein